MLSDSDVGKPVEELLMRALAAAALVAVLAFSVPPASAQVPGRAAPMMLDGAMLTVSAQGEIKVAPDIATISIGVVTQGQAADVALAANTAEMNAVVAVIKRDGVADKDIQTANLSVNPQYQYGQNEPPKLTGYEARNQLTVKIRALKKVGKVVDAVAGVGGNQINGISFGLDDDGKAMDAARVDAMKKASARAELYAGAANMKVDRILSISEGGAAAPPFPIAMARAEMAGSPPPPMAPGELTVTADVTVAFLLK
jgi:uncharacterized protein